MLAWAQDLLRRKYLLLQFLALLVWLVIEISGYGFGLLSSLLHRHLTNADGFHVSDLLNGAPPPGPVRLSRAERDAVNARVTAAFDGNSPKHDELAGLRWMYELKSGALCNLRGGKLMSN